MVGVRLGMTSAMLETRGRKTGTYIAFTQINQSCSTNRHVKSLENKRFGAIVAKQLTSLGIVATRSYAGSWATTVRTPVPNHGPDFIQAAGAAVTVSSE
jgi:hypothetical protein